MATFSITTPAKPHMGFARRGPKGEASVIYYDNTPGEVLSSQKSISLRKLIAVGTIGISLLTAASHIILGFP
jgi:hypothetical protein